MSSLSAANTKFTLDLFQQLGKAEGNVFYSPVSILVALGMLDLGAKGNTARQIEKVGISCPAGPAPAFLFTLLAHTHRDSHSPGGLVGSTRCSADFPGLRDHRAVGEQPPPQGCPSASLMTSHHCPPTRGEQRK